MEEDITRKKPVHQKTSQPEFEDNNIGEEYEIEVISNRAVYAKELESDQLPSLYYLIFWKDFLKEEKSWELASAIQCLRRLVNSFHK